MLRRICALLPLLLLLTPTFVLTQSILQREKEIDLWRDPFRETDDDGFALSLFQEKQHWYRRCQLEVRFPDGPYLGGRGRAELRCERGASPPVPDLFVERTIEPPDLEPLKALVRDSDLYSGGHVGFGSELLRVQCCRRLDSVVLLTRNESFGSGARRKLLDHLHELLTDLLEEGERSRPRGR
jgi:hypothetical protein